MHTCMWKNEHLRQGLQRREVVGGQQRLLIMWHATVNDQLGTGTRVPRCYENAPPQNPTVVLSLEDPTVVL
jgi:hypothetical protein